MTTFWSERKTGISSDIDKDILFTLMEKTNSNILITGAAGTGKSTLLRGFVQKTKKSCVVLAPTGIAATNIEGQTIHSFFALPPNIPTNDDIEKERFAPLYVNIDTLIVDEISMVRVDLFEAMDLILRKYKDHNKPFGGVQLILFGDLFQLPPVVPEDQKFALIGKYPKGSYYFFDFDSYKELDLWVVHLNQVYRQSDIRFIEILNHMQKNILTSEDLEVLNNRVDINIIEDNCVILSTRNDAVEEHNQNRLQLLSGETHTYKANIEKSAEFGVIKIEDTPAVQTLNLKLGARVVLLINDKEKRYYNGSLGAVVELSNDSVDVKLDSSRETIRVLNHDWEIIKNRYDFELKEIKKETIGIVSQIPLKLAWAMTIHKCQGQTLDKVMIDLRYRPWESGHAYVAFSRVRSLDGLKLKTKLKKEDILVDQKIINWETKIKEEKIDKIDKNQEIRVTGISYEESKEIITKINRELSDSLGIVENNLVSWKSQSSILVNNNPFFFSLIKSRIIFLLEELKEKEKKDIIIDEDKTSEIKLNYKQSPQSWLKDLQEKLKSQKDQSYAFEENKKQKQEAIDTIDVPVLVAAGPGTGKTQLIIEKTVYLIDKHKVEPTSILITTFTEKATKDLKRRIREKIQNKADEITICTIHSLCRKILENSICEESIMSETERYFLISTHKSELGLDNIPFEFNDLVAFYDTATENDVDPEKLIDSQKEEKDKILSTSYLKYIDLLKQLNKFDFAKLQQKAYHLLKEDHSILSQWQNKFQYVLVDEYQDTNPLQDAIIRMIASQKNKITVVGDEDQSIYGFRGASIENFRGFTKKYPNSKLFKLTVNHRSSKEIVDFSEQIISSRRAIKKDMISEKGSISSPIIRVYNNELEEARAITNWIKEQEHLIGYENITILCRSTKNISKIVDFLKDKKIPSFIYGTQPLLNNTCVKNIVESLLKMNGYEPENKEFIKLFYSIKIITETHNDLEEPDLIAIATLGKLLEESQKYTSLISEAIEMVHNIPERFIRLDKEPIVENCVKIMNIHQAKGLEFPVVIIPNVTKKVFDDRRNIEETAIPIPKELMINKEEFDSGEENRRIFYVGITRAESGLILTSIKNEQEQISEYIRYKVEDKHLTNIGDLNIPPKKENHSKIEWTKSSLISFNRCPFQYYLKYIINMPQLEKYPLQEGLRLHQELAKINNLFKVNGLANTSIEQCKSETQWDEMLNNYFNWAKENLSKIMEVESDLEYNCDDIYLKGKIDLLAKNKKEELILIDFKSGKYHPQPHDLELNFYNQLIKEKNKLLIIEQGVYSLSDNAFYKIEVDPSSAKEKIIEFKKSCEEKKFKRVKTNDKCSDCYFLNFCYSE